ncbi:hypothetical protein, partial [Burkholderia sp.]|uniref:hypothetical protein n=1 Tax=Burkholderia sp. TaxID=36773 RepID=UPI0025888EBF
LDMVGVVGSNPIEPTNEQNEGVWQHNLPTGNAARQHTNATRQHRVAFFFSGPKQRVKPRCVVRYTARYLIVTDNPIRHTTAAARRVESCAHRRGCSDRRSISTASKTTTLRAHDHVRGHDYRIVRKQR